MQLSVQCWAVRDDLTADAAAGLRALSAIGYRYVELAGTYGHSALEFRRWMDDAGLLASGMHVGLGDCESDLGRVLEEAAIFDCPYVIVPWVSAEDYAPGWEHLGRRLEAVAARVTAGGRKFAYHNHAFEFVRAGTSTGLETLLDSTSPRLVHAEIDTWWAHCGGVNPANLIWKYSGRTPLVHLKDGASCQEEVHREAGQGILDWTSILRACQDAGVEFGVVELDLCPRPPMDCVRVSFEYFQSRLSE